MLDLDQQRCDKWRLNGNPVRTVEDARAFIDDLGLCTLFPHKPALLLPTFIGAWAGSDERLPEAKQAFADPRAREATDLMVRLLRDRAAFETPLFGASNFLVSAAVFPFLYGVAGARAPQQPPKPEEKLSPLAQLAWNVIQQKGPVSRGRLREVLGAELTTSALDRALYELWARLRITRVGYDPGEGASWEILPRWAAQAVRQGTQISQAAALSALISKYLDCVVAAEAREVEDFFAHLVPRSKVTEALNALLAARELSFISIGHRSLVHVTPERAPRPERPQGEAVRAKQPRRNGRPSGRGQRRPA
jgi:hypothetical protein